MDDGVARFFGEQLGVNPFAAPRTSYDVTSKEFSVYLYVAERGGESGKQVGSMNEKSQVSGCYIT